MSAEQSTPHVEVLKPGILTTVQDLGRPCAQHAGVPPGGAMDRFALRVANLLVGNAEGAAALESTLGGPVLRFAQDTLVAVAGARFSGVPPLQPRLMRSGAILSLAEIETGCRGYIAFSGGVQVPAVMGSASTYSRGAYGGIQGRALKKGDRLELGEAPVAKPESLEHWHISESIVPQYSEKPTVRVVRGPQWDWFSEKAQQGFLSYTFTVSPDMDRMGVRLSGAALDVASSWEMHSEAVATGSVQIPRDGQPIVLMADRQTIGGYPKIANVITVDLPLLAQVRPGSKVRFAEVDLDTAQALLLAEENALAKLRAGLAEKFRR